MSNLCAGCRLNCCQNFTVDTEQYDPRLFQQTLKQHPFIIRTRRILVRYNCRDIYIGVYNCTRFDIATGECANYDTIPRPSFCERTGNIHKPHPNCLL